MRKNNILILDDEVGFRNELKEYLEENANIFTAGLPSEAFQILEKNHIDIAILDIRLPEMDGLSVLQKIKQKFPDTETIMMTGFGEMDDAVKALRLGASDFFNKPFKLSEIEKAVNRVSRYLKVSKEIKKSNGLNGTDIQIIGKSRAMQDVVELISKVAKSDDATVLITGESGTGKELVAKAIHNLSKRKNYRFIAVNCSSIPTELFENEFFGHKKGSFTDAKEDHTGLFQAAHKGTLFLDEIGDLKYELQTKFLRVIEDKKITEIGTNKEHPVDVRIIAATNQDLQQMVNEKRFRVDLYHRLNIFIINIPPLRERMEDVPLLIDHFIRQISKKSGKNINKIDSKVFEKLLAYDFPGNVRELKNMIERAVILSENDVLGEDCFVSFSLLMKNRQPELEQDTDEVYDLSTIEKNHIMKVLKITDYNKAKTARLLNISRQALDRKIKKYSII